MALHVIEQANQGADSAGRPMMRACKLTVIMRRRPSFPIDIAVESIAAIVKKSSPAAKSPAALQAAVVAVESMRNHEMGTAATRTQ